MVEKRQGQDLIRLYLPADLKEKFKLYCQLKGETMTEIMKKQIEQLLQGAEMTAMLKQRLGDEGDEPPTTKSSRKS